MMDEEFSLQVKIADAHSAIPFSLAIKEGGNGTEGKPFCL